MEYSDSAIAVICKCAKMYVMDNENKHTTRLALLLAFMVVMLVVVSIDQFRMSGKTDTQQAAALRVYAR